MKNINTAIQLIAVHLGLATSVALGANPVAGREEHPMTRPRLARWTAVLALLIAPVAAPVLAQETDTVTITGTFTSDSGEHTWSLAMYGTTYLHYGYISSSHYGSLSTDVRATSFDLRFSGPDADDLNRIASEQLAGGDVSLELRNVYQDYRWSTMALWIVSPDKSASFWAGHELTPNPGLFPSDADGYPIVTPEPFSFWNEEIYLSGYGFFYLDWPGPNSEISGSLGSAPATPTLSIGDSSVVEGDRGSSQLQFTVSRSGSGEGTVSVDYRTVAGTALAKSDYTAASGTLTFQPGVWSQTITITVKTDRTREPDETFNVEIFNAVGASVNDAVATGTILNDD